jgi:hypothetical protein
MSLHYIVDTEVKFILKVKDFFLFKLMTFAVLLYIYIWCIWSNKDAEEHKTIICSSQDETLAESKSRFQNVYVGTSVLIELLTMPWKWYLMIFHGFLNILYISVFGLYIKLLDLCRMIVCSKF